MSAGTGEAVVRCAGVAKRYGPTRPWVLRDVDAEVMAGQVVHLDGPNGSGKSTLLRVLAGVSPPSRGERRAGDGCRVGFVPEAGKAPRAMPAGRYLRAHAGVAGAPAEVEPLAERLGCASFLSEPLDSLSKGTLRKMLLIGALAGDRSLLVLDEPFGGLDAGAQETLAGLLGERAAAGAAVVFSDHREGGARLAADRRWLVVEGGLVDEAPRSVERRRRRVPAGESDAELARLLAAGRHVRSLRTLASGEVEIEVDDGVDGTGDRAVDAPEPAGGKAGP
jgi:ABC-type multidrug transport system ATPase subunit